MTIRLDHILENMGVRLDASETLNLRRALEHVRATTYDKQFPEFKGRKLVPVDNSVPNGAETVAFDTYSPVGEAEITSDYANDAPSVDVLASSQAKKIFGIRSSYGFNIQELRAATMAGSRLSDRKAEAARRAVEQRQDGILLLGDSRYGMTGLFNSSGALTYTISTGAGGTDWADKTPDEILTDMYGMENQIVEDTNDVEQPNVLVLPLTAYNFVKQTRVGDGIEGTILQVFLRNAIHIKEVEHSIKLESNAGWTGRRMVAYRRDPSKLVGVIPQEFEQFAPQQSGMLIKTECHARAAGVDLFYPKSVCYGTDF